MPLLRQETERIEELARRVKNERDTTVNDLLGTLRGIDVELDQSWDGKSQQQFHASYGDWITKLEQYTETLENVHAYLMSVAQNFRELDEAAAQAAQGAATPQ